MSSLEMLKEAALVAQEIGAFLESRGVNRAVGYVALGMVRAAVVLQSVRLGVSSDIFAVLDGLVADVPASKGDLQ